MVQSTRLNTSIELKLVAFGMKTNAVRETPTTEPTVLTKKTRPDPLSPCRVSAAGLSL